MFKPTVIILYFKYISTYILWSKSNRYPHVHSRVKSAACRSSTPDSGSDLRDYPRVGQRVSIMNDRRPPFSLGGFFYVGFSLQVITTYMQVSCYLCKSINTCVVEISRPLVLEMSDDSGSYSRRLFIINNIKNNIPIGMYYLQTL